MNKPQTKRFTEKYESGGKSVRTLKTNGTLIIDERVDYSSKGEILRIHIDYSDKSGEYKTRDGKMSDHRDNVTYTYEPMGANFLRDEEEYERANWSTGWQSSLEGKMREAEIRSKALKYFAKRKAKLMETEA